MHRPVLAVMMLAAAGLAGCSSNGVSTASILGTAPTPPPVAGAAPAAGQPGVTPVAAPVPQSSPTDRAFQVGTVSARAVKCGYNFDAAKVKTAFLAQETQRGTPPDQLVNVEKVYAVAYGGVTKAAAADDNYCSDRKTETIKADLARLLAGDFEPPQKAIVAQKKDDDDGFFGGLFDGSSSESGPGFGSGDWWEKQAEKAGN
ncbi:hypothetical protein [Hyphomicrobium sp.]|uniref:hypothetical protein n=1 Tax=Hyphomicrobium sp. TaxID=82 RepID=UPI002E308DD8|nr:hypothetical protein [Hyphomicrobium sp.]HEX2843236.1 hypothetical protein [Hyphomicrobium sp.]